MKFKVGDKVKLNPKIQKFAFCRGTVEDEEIGIVKEIDKEKVRVAFSGIYQTDYWTGMVNELVLVESCNFTKADLQDGDICTLRNEEKGVYFQNSGICNTALDYPEIANDLTNAGGVGEKLDIIKVERPTGYETVFERKEEPKEMTLKEVCEELGYKIKIIKED